MRANGRGHCSKSPGVSMTIWTTLFGQWGGTSRSVSWFLRIPRTSRVLVILAYVLESSSTLHIKRTLLSVRRGPWHIYLRLHVFVILMSFLTVSSQPSTWSQEL